jgi:hypothetical protein
MRRETFVTWCNRKAGWLVGRIQVPRVIQPLCGDIGFAYSVRRCAGNSPTLTCAGKKGKFILLNQCSWELADGEDASWRTGEGAAAMDNYSCPKSLVSINMTLSGATELPKMTKLEKRLWRKLAFAWMASN